MKEVILDLLYGELKNNLKKEDILNMIEVPSNVDNGDYAFPCFSLAKIEKRNPLLIAENLVEKLRRKLASKDEISSLDANAGYVNFFIDKRMLARDVLDGKNKSKLKDNKRKKLKGMIEFSQANTHKAFHVGHIRGTAIGESLARIAEFFGGKVLRANYQGDSGMHVAKWIWCYKKYHSKEKLKEDEKWVAGIYVDAVKRLVSDKTGKLQKEVDEINRKLDKRDDPALNELWEKTRKLSLDSLENIYSDLNTQFDKYYFESELEGEAKKIVDDLLKKKIAVKDDGAVIIDFKKKGFDNLGVWVLLRKDGTVLYSAKDIALALRKFKENKINWSVYVHGAEQNLHFKQLIKTLELMNFKNVKSVHDFGFGLVRLPGKKMSSRTGDNILYSDFKKEIVDYAKKQISDRVKISERELERRALAVAVAAIKYSFLKQSINNVIVFDKDDALRFEGDTGPYLLYSYARASSIVRKNKSKKKVKILDLNNEEIALVKKINDFEDVVERAYDEFSPNLVANYSYDLAKLFNEFYHECPVLGSLEEGFRLKLVEIFRRTLKKSLDLLGIDVLEEM